MSIVKKITNIEKHTIQCRYCQRDVLDHMTKCPFCEEALTPTGYKPMDEITKKQIKRITGIIGFAVAVLIVILILINR